MTDNRKPLLQGDILYLDGVSYLLTGDAVMQGDVIAYKATTPDSGPWDDILIREFFPGHLNHDLFRKENGELQCDKTVRRLFEEKRARFLKGEQIESKYLESLSSATGAKSVCYEEHGTSYSVRRLYKSVALETWMEKDHKAFSLEIVLPLVHNLLDSIESLHREGFLHLAVQPSQLHLLTNNVLFLDHIVLWENGNLDIPEEISRDCFYIAPEIRLQDRKNIGPASDLYAVAAWMCRMLYGRDCTPEHFKRELTMQKSPTACFLLSLFRKGLHILPRKRFSTTDEFRSALRVLEDLMKKERSNFQDAQQEERRYAGGE